MDSPIRCGLGQVPSVLTQFRGPLPVLPDPAGNTHLCQSKVSLGTGYLVWGAWGKCLPLAVPRFPPERKCGINGVQELAVPVKTPGPSEVPPEASLPRGTPLLQQSALGPWGRWVNPAVGWGPGRSAVLLCPWRCLAATWMGSGQAWPGRLRAPGAVCRQQETGELGSFCALS